MNGNDVINKIQETIELLYQNHEQKGIAAVEELLVLFQNMLQNLTEEQTVGCGKFALLMLKELLEAYQNQDVLGMADCLMEKSMIFVQFVYQEKY